jgi:hypothetical protein
MNRNLDPEAREKLLRLVLGGDGAVLRDDEIFIKTRLGRLEAGEAHSYLPRRLRTLLILVDGRRSVADFRNGLTRFRNLDECFDMLRQMGYIEPLPERLDF